MKPYLPILLILCLLFPALVEAQTKPAVKAPVKKKKIVKKPVSSVKNDTTYYYYTDKKISVKVSPWVNSEQKVFLYDRKGVKTYTFTNSRRHGSTGTDFKYHANGAVKEALTHTQPDGGIQRYRTSTTFSEDNEPQWRVSSDELSHKLEMPEKFYWDKANGKWVKQEIVEEQPVPVKKD